MKKTVYKQKSRIICTLGPASESPEIIAALIQAGMNVARLNFSHGTHPQHASVVHAIRSVSKRLNTQIAILQDLSGPKMRIGSLENGPVHLTDGQRFDLTSRAVPGDKTSVSLNYPGLITVAGPGRHVLLGDGNLELLIVKKTSDTLICEVLHGGQLEGHKGITVPGIVLPESVPTQKDLADLEFGLKHGVDWIALSFVSSASEIRALRQAVQAQGKDTPIIAKIERQMALHNLEEIVQEADGIMVARGDLGLEIGLQEIPFAQKQIIQTASLAGKPEITATQMLESMIANPRPTRAEVNDVANAILDGSDGVMLSAETALGAYPVKACQIMSEIAATAEKHLDPVVDLRNWPYKVSSDSSSAIAYAACWTAMATQAQAVICCTRSGLTARLIARHRPAIPIVVTSPYEHTLRRCMLYWGTFPIQIEMAADTDLMIKQSVEAALSHGLLKPGERVVIVGGVSANEPGPANMIKVSTL